MTGTQNLIEEYSLTGTHYHYYAVCKTKLWYYHHRLIDNSENEYIKMGSQIDISSYPRSNSSRIGKSKIDFIEEKVVDGNIELEVNEVKKSSKMKQANRLQLLHYLFLISAPETTLSGCLRFPEERKTSTVEWNSVSKEEHRETTEAIVKVISGECPPPTQKPYCNGCSMEEFCFSGTGDKNER